jgi:methylated-DNA-[protein]-cysteine S-methyltransferase
MISASTVTTPGGPLTILAKDGTVVAAGFTDDPDRLHRRLATNELYARVDHLGAISDAVARWLDGDLDALDGVRVQQPGTSYQQAIWAALQRIPAGSTLSYGKLAAEAGMPLAARAAGSACGRNLVAPFVPCHRAITSSGGLGGYEYGLPTKRWLLDHEQRYGIHSEG